MGPTGSEEMLTSTTRTGRDLLSFGHRELVSTLHGHSVLAESMYGFSSCKIFLALYIFTEDWNLNMLAKMAPKLRKKITVCHQYGDEHKNLSTCLSYETPKTQMFRLMQEGIFKLSWNVSEWQRLSEWNCRVWHAVPYVCLVSVE